MFQFMQDFFSQFSIGNWMYFVATTAYCVMAICFFLILGEIYKILKLSTDKVDAIKHRVSICDSSLLHVRGLLQDVVEELVKIRENSDKERIKKQVQKLKKKSKNSSDIFNNISPKSILQEPIDKKKKVSKRKK